jgi:hypothetical protein
LRPGGRFIAATPNAESLAHRKFGHAWRGLEPPRHLHVFTPASILSLARSAGFMISRTELSIRGARGEWKSSREIQRRLKLPGNTPIHSCWWGSSGHISAQTKVLVGAAKPEQKTELILIATK